MPIPSTYEGLLALYNEQTAKILEVRKLQRAYLTTRGKNPDAAKDILQKSKDAERALDTFLTQQQDAENSQRQLF